jgi:chromosome segregation ATPase
LTVAEKLLILVVQTLKQPVRQLMTIPSILQGLIETKDGKVFELDSPKGVAWVEAIGSFRFEPAGNAKPYTVRKEASGYWYGCRKVAGKVRKKYIGKTSEVSTAKLEEIAEALEVPPVPRVNKVPEVAQKVAQVAQVPEVAQDRLATLESEVAMLRQAVQVLQEALPGKSEAGDSEELPKVDSEVAEGLHKVAEELRNELGNLSPEPEHIEFLKRLVAKKDPLISSDLWQEIERLKESHRRLRLKMGAERRESIEKISDLEDWVKGLTRRIEEKQARLDELEAQLEQERADREEVERELSGLKQKLAAAGKDLPEAADLLNQLKAKRKKSSATLADVEKILEILGGDNDD